MLVAVAANDKQTEQFIKAFLSMNTPRYFMDIEDVVGSANLAPAHRLAQAIPKRLALKIAFARFVAHSSHGLP
jgi:hypothetical protein